MSIVDLLITFLIILAVVGIGWIIIAGLLFLYGWLETLMIRRRIPITIKKEVENDRTKREYKREEYRRKFAGTGSPEIKRALDSARISAADFEPKRIQSFSSEPDNGDRRNPIVNDDRTSEDERRIESAGRKSKWRRI